MKFRRTSLIFSVIFAVSFFFVTNSAQAQAPNLDRWVGEWFKISISASGYCVENSRLYSSPDKFTVYLKVWNWDVNAGVLNADLYELKNDQWKVMSLNLNYFSGEELNFLFWFDDTNDYLTVGGVGNITGTLKAGVLKSAKFTVPTGYHKDYSFNDPNDPWYCTGLAKLSGTLTSSVPVPPEIIIH